MYFLHRPVILPFGGGPDILLSSLCSNTISTVFLYGERPSFTPT